MRIVAGIEEVLAVVGAIDQLLCLPEPLMPVKASRGQEHEVVLCARRFIVLKTIMLWSEPTEVGSYTGAISNGGRHLVVAVLDGMPRRQSSRSSPS